MATFYLENHPALGIHFNAVSYQTKGQMGKKMGSRRGASWGGLKLWVPHTDNAEQCSRFPQREVRFTR